jgi:Cof subfamily protein (haloacid dehalogenase superfamily)
MIRLLAVDLDGTILDEQLCVHPRVPEAFNQAQIAGLGTVIATGRSIQSAKRIVGLFPPNQGFVCSNGCDVYGPDGQSIARRFLPESAKKLVIDFAAQNQFHISAYGVEDVYSINDSKYLSQYRNLLGGARVDVISPENLKDLPLFKLVFIHESHMIPSIKAEVSMLLDDLEVDFTESSPQYLEILPRNANKATGLKSLADFLGLQSEQIAAIGDYKNDLEMLKWVGLPGAVGNALPEVKRIAHQVVGTNQEGGVAEFIHFLLGRSS